MPERAATPEVARIAVALAAAALVGISAAARAAPSSCNLAVTVTPVTIPAGSRQARVRIPPSPPGIEVRSSSGTIRPPVAVGGGALIAEFTAGPASPPLAIVAAVSERACGFSVVRVTATPDATIPARPVALAVVEPTAAPADREVEVLVYVFAIDGRGAARRGSAPAFRPAKGIVTRVEPLGPGVWRGSWTVPAGEAGAGTVEVAFGSEPPASISLVRRAGPPATIEIIQDPARPLVDARTPASVIVRLRDSAGNPTDSALELESDVATIGAPVRLEPGVYRSPIAVPPGTPQSSMIITAIAGRAVATATLSIAPPAAAKITVVPHAPIRADGSTPGKLEVLAVEVVDAFGSPASDIPVGSAGRGEFREALVVSPGHWALPYRPPRVWEDTVDPVVIRAGAASTTLDLELLASRLSVSLGLKAAIAVGGSVGPAVGLEGGVWTRFGRTQLGLVLDVSWWTLSQSSTTTVGGAPTTYSATQNHLPFLLELAWRLPFASRWMLWANTGAGGSLVSNSARLEGQPSVSESGVAPAASVSLSAGPRLGPGSLFLELRATWIGDAGLSTLSGSSTTFLALLGYRFDVD